MNRDDSWSLFRYTALVHPGLDTGANLDNNSSDGVRTGMCQGCIQEQCELGLS